jgi:hypothetical protein
MFLCKNLQRFMNPTTSTVEHILSTSSTPAPLGAYDEEVCKLKVLELSV